MLINTSSIEELSAVVMYFIILSIIFDARHLARFLAACPQLRAYSGISHTAHHASTQHTICHSIKPKVGCGNKHNFTFFILIIRHISIPAFNHQS